MHARLGGIFDRGAFFSSAPENCQTADPIRSNVNLDIGDRSVRYAHVQNKLGDLFIEDVNTCKIENKNPGCDTISGDEDGTCVNDVNFVNKKCSFFFILECEWFGF